MGNTSKITCVGDFLKIIKRFTPDNTPVFYRGQRNCNYGINSSVSRLLKKSNLVPDRYPQFNPIKRTVENPDFSSYSLAHDLFSSFKIKHIVYPDVNTINGYSMNDIDLHVAAQHYGLATRVIDWSYSPLVALYFSVEEKKEVKVADSDAAVFMIWNEANKKIDLNSSGEFLERIEFEREVHAKIYDMCLSFSQEYYYGVSTRNPRWDLEASVLDDFFQSLKNLYYKGKVGAILNLNSKTHLSILISDYSNARKAFGDYKEVMFNWVNLFVEDMNGNYQRSHDSIDIYNDGVTIIEPLPINQRVKNQQGILMFCNNIRDEVYPAAMFDNSNSVTLIDEHSLSEVHGVDGLIKIVIPEEYVGVIRSELETYGFSKDFIYPEVMSFTEYLQKKIVAKRSC